MKVVELLKKLVEIKSESGKEDEIKLFVSDYLSRHIDVVEGENFIAGKVGDFVISTHLDTVGFKRDFEFDGEYAYGSGVCDAKGSLAAILLAVEEICKKDELRFTPAFFCGEEEGGEGSRDFAEKFDFEEAIVMEPTDLKIASHHYGSLDLHVKAKGVAAHGATPEFGVNAIEISCEILGEMRKRGLDATVLKIEGGGEEYVIPDSCSFLADVRYPADVSLREVEEKLRFILEYGEYRISDAYEGFRSGSISKILERAMENCGLRVEHTHMPSWTDALNLKKRADVVVWGPGELHLCHTRRERIRIADIEKAKEVIVEINGLLEP